MEKLKMQSKNLAEENVTKIRTLFPNCVTEGKIDFDLLRQELSSELVEGRDERYRLEWAGKRQAILTANSPIAKTLRPVREESVNFDTTENVYIEGDNLDVLKLLHETYLGRVKMIYIDPPYNTGKDFIYNDDFAEGAEEYLVRSNQVDEQGNRMLANKDTSGRYHSDWLSMMYMRLKLARDLLTDDGVIFMSIDDKEQANLRKMCDEIFGADNFVANLIWEKVRIRKNSAIYFTSNHDFILCYAKKARRDSNDSGWVRNLISREESNYKNPDNDPNGAWMRGSITANHYYNADYTITKPNGVVLSRPKNASWRYSEESIAEFIRTGRMIWGDGDSYPSVKKYEKDAQEGLVPKTILTFEEVGGNPHGAEETKELFDGKKVFENPKPASLVQWLMDLDADKNSIVLDFFSGSATTAHAVIQLNAEDGGNRRFICVQLPESLDKNLEEASTDSKQTLLNAIGICDSIGKPHLLTEIGKERIRRAGRQIVADLESKLDTKERAKTLDTGFRVFRLADSNMREVYYNPKEYTQDMLIGLDRSIKEDRTTEDVLIQVMLDKGVSLSSKIERRTTEIGKQTYYIVGDIGYGIIDLICCLDNSISTEAVKEIAKLQPECCVFLDSGMSSDATLINLRQVFDTYSPKSKIEVI